MNMSLPASESHCIASRQYCSSSASMCTRQIGQRRFRTNHWSTQVMWNRCIHGKRLQHTSANIPSNLGRE